MEKLQLMTHADQNFGDGIIGDADGEVEPDCFINKTDSNLVINSMRQLHVTNQCQSNTHVTVTSVRSLHSQKQTQQLV